MWQWKTATYLLVGVRIYYRGSWPWNTATHLVVEISITTYIVTVKNCHIFPSGGKNLICRTVTVKNCHNFVDGEVFLQGVGQWNMATTCWWSYECTWRGCISDKMEIYRFPMISHVKMKNICRLMSSDNSSGVMTFISVRDQSFTMGMGGQKE